MKKFIYTLNTVVAILEILTNDTDIIMKHQLKIKRPSNGTMATLLKLATNVSWS